MKKFILLLAFFVLSACDDSSSASGDNGSGGNRGGIPDTVETFMELSDYDCGKSQKCVATYLTEYHDMAVCDGNNGWVIGTLIEKMDCDFSSSSVNSSDSKDSPSSAGTSTKSSNSNSSGNGTKSSNSSASKVESSFSKGEVPKSYAEAKVMPSGTYDCTKYKCVTTEYLNQEFLETGKYGEILDERDGQVYKTAQIGEQIWMAQNLNYADSIKTPSLLERNWCYEYNEEKCAYGGRLYTWAAAIDSIALYDSGNGVDCGRKKTCSLPSKVQGLCPMGWHLPDTTEWNVLIDEVGETDDAGKALKSQTGWTNNRNGTDAYGFAALPVGSRPTDGFVNAGDYTDFWSSSEIDGYYVYGVDMYYGRPSALMVNRSKVIAVSVRCLKDSD
ncbi:fibrobacter succinogenes major paralogous domain-containing protein [uncultured Fibrobacter sp.]|uniref:fibrobacter succinogenes major paralogous domain-containing protein n=1 Tax=uncultured Fibrobacter sp. TaxID=261512 RepID=UPI00260F24A2|nr:fibrobacter succinogenes major paralogous domain-containing protein [uncultured Fibrobacter sp.]